MPDTPKYPVNRDENNEPVYVEAGQLPTVTPSEYRSAGVGPLVVAASEPTYDLNAAPPAVAPERSLRRIAEDVAATALRRADTAATAEEMCAFVQAAERALFIAQKRGA